MEATVLSSGSTSSTIQLTEQLFSREYNEGLIHQVVTAFQAGGRAGTKAQKNRSAVSGGGAKPWSQKGSGRARAGTSRSPIWRKGGVTFAASPRDHSVKVNRKMYRAALSVILSELLRSERLLIVDEFTLEAPKTKALAQKLAEMQLDDVLIITDKPELNVELASRNLYKVAVIQADQINPVNLIAFEKVVVTVDALKAIEETLS